MRERPHSEATVSSARARARVSCEENLHLCVRRSGVLQISTTDRTHARTGPVTQRAQVRCPRCRNENFACEEQLGHPALLQCKTFFRLFAGWSQSGSLRSRIYYVWVPRPPKAPNPIRDSHIDSQTFSHVFFQRFRPQNQSVLVSMLVNLLLQSFTRVLLGFRLRRSLRFFASLRSRSALL